MNKTLFSAAELLTNAEWTTKIGPSYHVGKVYFIEYGRDGPIKIGYTQDLTTRQRALQLSSPLRLKTLAVMRGTLKTESMLHCAFDNLLIWGELFEPQGALLDFITLL